MRTKLLITPILSILASLAFVSVSQAAIATGPSDNSFYAPASSKYKTGQPGDVIWMRNAQAATTLSEASRSLTLVYKSRSLSGKLIPVSGTVWIPKGVAPAGGWPIVSWGHGTTGSADVCAPSRIADLSSGAYTSYVFPTLDAWLSHGYAVAMTDYEGLGTPGTHPWLIGPSEGRGMVDIVKAARKVDTHISNNWISAGHSQGGHAALFAASLAQSWGNGLNLKGVVAFAPANNMKTTVLSAAGFLPGPSSVSGMGALLIRSLSYSDSAIKLNQVMPAAPYALMGQIEQRCIGSTSGTLGAADSFGQFSPQGLLKGWDSAHKDWRNNPKWAKLVAVMNGPKIDPVQNIKAPILLLQGKSDGTVLEGTTATLQGQLKKKNPSQTVTYTNYDGVDHAGVVAAGLTDASAFMLAKFGR